jgi:hypothetical protein
MPPRIYLYKVTFEETPDWYWGIHKEKRYGEKYLGSPKTHAWKWEVYTPKLDILCLFPYTDEGWEESLKVEARIIKNDINNPLCLNENCGGVYSLESRRRAGKTTGQRNARELTGFLSPEYTQSQKYIEDRRKGVATKTREELVEAGKRGAKAQPRETRVKNAAIMNSQIWESLEDGYRSTAAGVAKHNRYNGWDPAARAPVYSKTKDV